MAHKLSRLVEVKDRRIDAAQSVHQRALEMCDEAQRSLEEQRGVCEASEQAWNSSRRGLLEDPRCRNYLAFEQASRHAERLRQELICSEHERERREKFLDEAQRFVARTHQALLLARRAREKMLRQSDRQASIDRANAALAEDRDLEDHVELLASQVAGQLEKHW